MIDRRFQFPLVLAVLLVAVSTPAIADPAKHPTVRNAVAHYKRTKDHASKLFKAQKNVERELNEIVRAKQGYRAGLLQRIPFEMTDEQEAAQQNYDKVVRNTLYAQRRKDAAYAKSWNDLKQAKTKLSRLKSSSSANQKEMAATATSILKLERSVKATEESVIASSKSTREAKKRLDKIEAALKVHRDKLLKDPKFAAFDKQHIAKQAQLEKVRKQVSEAQIARTAAKRAAGAAYAKIAAAERAARVRGK